VEGQVRFASLERTSREATKGDDNASRSPRSTTPRTAEPACHLRPGQADGGWRARHSTASSPTRPSARRSAPASRSTSRCPRTSTCPSRTSAGTSSTRTGRTGSPCRAACGGGCAADPQHASGLLRGEVRLVHRGGRVVPERAGRARRLLHVREGRHHETSGPRPPRQPEQPASTTRHRRDRHVSASTGSSSSSRTRGSSR